MYIVYMVYIVYAMYAVYRSLPPVVWGGGGPESLPRTPPYHWGGGAVITDHGIIYIYIYIYIYLYTHIRTMLVSFRFPPPTFPNDSIRTPFLTQRLSPFSLGSHCVLCSFPASFFFLGLHDKSCDAVRIDLGTWHLEVASASSTSL